MNLDGQAARCKSAGAGHSRLDDGGFVLVALLVGISIASVWMVAALPSWRQQVIREREQELIFRGEQYARAIRLYRDQMGGTLPTTLDDLVSGNFLRKKYKDPITNDEFLPRVGCVPIGNPGVGNPGQRGVPPPGGGAPIGAPRGGRMSQSAFPPVEIILTQARGPGMPSPPPGSPIIPVQPGRGPAQPGRGPVFPGRGPIQPGRGQPGPMPGQFPGQGGIQGGGICGVQSKSKATSIVIYNGQQQHDLWQFDMTLEQQRYSRTIQRLAGGIQPGGMPGGMPGGIGNPGGQSPNFPGRGVGPGGVFPPPGGPPTMPGGRRGD